MPARLALAGMSGFRHPPGKTVRGEVQHACRQPGPDLLPTLFYAACLAAFVLAAVGMWTLIFAWGFAACRAAQSLVHMTSNSPGPRGVAFSLGAVFMLALWINIALAVLAAI
jgi:hypothetical protein